MKTQLSLGAQGLQLRWSLWWVIAVDKEAEIKGYCSWCFERAIHTRSGTNRLGRGVFKCSKCGNRTVMCIALGCYHMARGEGRVDDVFCSAHAGQIDGFEHLSMKLKRIDDYQEFLGKRAVNFGKAKLVATLALGSASLAAPAALIWAAPAVGGAVGSTFFGLSGAAATSKGLATLGFGALSAGGWGMAGGTAVVTALGTATGGTLGGVAASAYYRTIKDFKITRIKDGRGPSVIIVNGFLTKKEKTLVTDWINTLGHHYQSNPWYLLEWENASVRRLAASAPSLCLEAWRATVDKAIKTGSLLSEIISRVTTSRKYVLLGHSLGAQVITACLQGLSGKGVNRVKAAHLLGGAVGLADGKYWDTVASSVTDQVHNYYSKHDDVLRYLFRAGSAFVNRPAIGRNPIRTGPANIQNHDVSEWVSHHNDFKNAAVNFLAR